MFPFVFAVSLLFCVASARLWTLIKVGSRDEADTQAIQAVHSDPTPRLGGLAIFLALWLAVPFVPAGMREFFALLLVSTLPVFVVGLVEDIDGGVRPRTRLVAAAVSSAIALLLLGTAITRVGVPGLDGVIALLPVAVLFTIFTTTGVSNAFNLIDGLNGLSASAALLALGGLTWVALAADMAQVAPVTILVAAAIIGFLMVNYPFGKVFLGDAGAYSLGHLLAWIAIAMMSWIPQFTPWSALLIFFWPIADTLFAIYRRTKTGAPMNQPDRRHHHHLVLEFVRLSAVERRWPRLVNAASTLIMLPLMAAPVVAGVLVWDDPVPAGLALLAFTILFVGSYRLGLVVLGDMASGEGVARRIHIHERMTMRHAGRRLLAVHRISAEDLADLPQVSAGNARDRHRKTAEGSGRA